jgi:hypothetical protein
MSQENSPYTIVKDLVQDSSPGKEFVISISCLSQKEVTLIIKKCIILLGLRL